MKKVLFFAAVALVAFASCSDETFVGDVTSPQDNSPSESNAIVFASATQGVTRAGEFVGATAAEKLGGMFVVEGTKGSEQTNSPSTGVVFDNYLVGYTANTAGTTESNSHNWEYVGKQTGITDRMTDDTWTALHGSGTAQTQSVKYWDYSTDQYDFIAWSTGELAAVTDAAVSGSAVKVTRINTGTDLSSTTAGKGGFTLTAASANDLKQCYYTDINTVLQANYGSPVTLTFRNMAAKVRVALYETVPGYSVKDVKFYDSDANPIAPIDLGTGTVANATLFTMGSEKLPQSGSVLVYYPHIGTTHRNEPQTKDYNKASVSVTSDPSTEVTAQAFGELTDQYTGKESYEEDDDIYLGRTLPNATYAGSSADDYYTAVIPNSTGVALTLRVDYTLVSTDGSGESIKVYGAKAVVPATYTEWQPNYAYTYVFKISDNSNGWTSQTYTDPKGLFPITFDAVVTSFIDANAEQTTVTTVATPSITTYQQGHDHANRDEYYNNQKAGKDQTNVKDLYVQVMDNSGATPELVDDLDDNNSLLFAVTTTGTTISEATVMDALLNRINTSSDASPRGRNGITLTTNSHIANNVDEIVNGVDDQPISITGGEAAEIDIDALGAGTYAYVYVVSDPTGDDEKVYNVVSPTTAEGAVSNYYEVDPDYLVLTSDATAQPNKVYFVKNVDATNALVDYTFKQTKESESVVTGLYEATIDPDTHASLYTAGNFYFDVYNRNNGKYAVKVIKVEAPEP